MKALLLSISKALVFLIGIGWSAHYYLITEIKGQIEEKTAIIEREKNKDVSYINGKLQLLDTKINRVDNKMDQVINILIKERK